MKNFLGTIIVIVLFLSANVTQAQDKLMDSINNAISQATSDTQRINRITSKLQVTASRNLDTTIALAQETLKSAMAIKYYKGEFDLRLRLVMSYSFKGMFPEAKNQIDSIENIIQPAGDSVDYADLYNGKGLYYGIQSKYDSSAIWLEHSIRIFERVGSNILPALYSNIAISYQQQSMYAQALVFQQRALRIAEEKKAEGSQSNTLVNMANTYSLMGDTAKAEQQFMRAIEIAKRRGITNVELYAYSNLASMYYNQRRWQDTYDFALKAAKLGHQIGDRGIEAASYSKVALGLIGLNNLPEAEKMAAQSIAIADSSTQPFPGFQAYSAMGEVLRLQKNYKSAITYFEKGLLKVKDADNYSADFAKIFQQLSDCYENIGNYPVALQHYKKFANITDSVSRKDNVRKATELSMNFEFDKKQAVAKAEQDKKDSETQREKNQQLFAILALGIGVLAVLTIALMLLRNNKNKQKANVALTQEKEKVESTLTELKAAQAHLIQSEKMASLGELTAGIAHEIQNPLNFVNNFSEVSSELLVDMNGQLQKGDLVEAEAIANDIRQNLEKITFHGKRADSIVKGMLQHSRASSGQKEATDINNLADEYLRLAFHGMRSKDKSFQVSLVTDFDKSLRSINVIPQEIGRVLLNLINNAFYAVSDKQKTAGSDYKPTVSLTTINLGRTAEIIVHDNGTGIPQKVIDKIFQPFFTTKPTGQGTGLGLSLAYDIVKAHGGELKVKTTEGEGTTFTLELKSNPA